jgi:hypothetical protein
MVRIMLGTLPPILFAIALKRSVTFPPAVLGSIGFTFCMVWFPFLAG